MGDTPMLTVKQTLISIYKQLSIFSIDELTFPIKSCQYTDIFDAKFMIFSKICLHLAMETKFKSRCYKIYGISKKSYAYISHIQLRILQPKHYEHFIN